MWAAGPPKPITPSLRKRRATSPARPRRAAGSGARCGGVVAHRGLSRGGVYSGRRRPHERGREAGARARAGDGGGLTAPSRRRWSRGSPRSRFTVGPCSTSGPGPAASPSTSPRGPGACSGSTPTRALSSRRSAARARPGSPTSLFVVADAEQVDYRAFGQPDLVVAHLCMSDAIVARAGAGLPPGGVLAFAAFHTDQWRETGRVSRFAYGADRARAVLGDAGLRVERLEVETEIARFSSEAEALAPGRRSARPMGGGRALGGLGAVRRRGRADPHPEPAGRAGPARWRADAP